VACDGEDLGRVAAEVGAGRRRVDDQLDHGAGVLIHSRIGDRVEIGQPLATLLLGDRDVESQRLTLRIRNAFEIGDRAVAEPKLIVGAVDEVLC